MLAIGSGAVAQATQSDTPDGQRVTVGGPAPEFTTGQVIRGPAEISLGAMRGRVVVVEFWASWCSPCIAAMPHIEAMAKEVATEGIAFVAISADEPTKIERQASGRTDIAWLRDPDGAIARSYGVRTLPHTVVIDAAGVIRAVTTPDRVNADILRRVARGDAIDVAGKASRESDLQWDLTGPFNPGGEEPRSQAIIEPTSCDGAGSIRPPGGRSFTADGITIDGLLSEAFGVSAWRITLDLPDIARSQQYRASIWVPPGHEETLSASLRDAIETQIDLEMSWVTRERDVLVMAQREDGHRLTEGSGAGTFSFFRGKLQSVAAPLERLRAALENFAGLPVIDETGLNGLYTYEVAYTPGAPVALRNELTEKLGLELRPERRKLEILVVRLKESAP